jgi:PfaB family protein
MTFEPLTFENLAIAGMDAAWGGCDGINRFERLVYTTSGGDKSSTFADCDLLSETALRALHDAGFPTNRGGRMHIAAVTAGASPPPAGWDWADQTMDLSSHPNPLAAAVSEAERLLASQAADAVVFAACSGKGHPHGDTPLASSKAALGFDRDVHSWRIGQGAGAVVFVRASQALHEGWRLYAVIRSMAVANGAVFQAGELPVPPVLDAVRGCCQSAIAAAGIAPAQIGYVEAFASGFDTMDGIEIAGLVQAYRQPVDDLPTALGSAQSQLGYLGAASGLAGLVQAALCVFHRFVPGAPGWTGPKLPALWRGAPFYVPVESQPWFAKADGQGRLAGISAPGTGGSYAHLILGEVLEQPVRSNNALADGGFHLFPLVGGSLQEILNQLEDLSRELTSVQDLSRLAAEVCEQSQRSCDAAYGLAIVGRNQDEVLREIEMAQRALPGAFEKGSDWQTPMGSYFTSQPVGREGGVALVYPGAFNSYPGVGKDLLHLFPNLHQYAASITNNLGEVFHERQLYPRSLTPLSKEAISAQEASLLADPIAMLISGAVLALLYTRVLQDGFGILPSAAFGYSLGENSMMFATGVWAQGDQAADRLKASDSFRARLAGSQLAVREYWGMSSDTGAETGELWSNYLVMCPPEKIQAALESESRVYLTHINTPRQVVIGGDPQACQRVLAKLRCSSLQAPFDYALHCEAMRSEFDALVDLHDWPVENVPPQLMYSAADYSAINIERHEISQKIGHMLTTPLDFPRLINKVYEDGARVFIEVGAGSNCARWIDESLKNSPHLALSLNRRGTDDYTTLVRSIARLHSHRVPLDMTRLYQISKERLSL